jgi:hypothetical protein
MPRYRKVDLEWHNHPLVRELAGPPANPQTLIFDVLAGPRSTAIPGVAVARPAVLADDRRWTLVDTEATVAECQSKGILEADIEAGMLWIPIALELDSSRPGGSKPFGAWITTLREQVPPCDLRGKLWTALGNKTELWGNAYVAAFLKAFPDGNPDANRKAFGLPIERHSDCQSKGIPQVAVEVEVREDSLSGRARAREGVHVLRATEPGDWSQAAQLWADQEARRAALRAEVDATMRPLSLTPGSAELQPIVDLLREGIGAEELRHCLEVAEAECRAKRSGQHFNGVTNWRREAIAHARSQTVEAPARQASAPRFTRRKGKSAAELMAEADELEARDRQTISGSSEDLETEEATG